MRSAMDRKITFNLTRFADYSQGEIATTIRFKGGDCGGGQRSACFGEQSKSCDNQRHGPQPNAVGKYGFRGGMCR